MEFYLIDSWLDGRTVIQISQQRYIKIANTDIPHQPLFDKFLHGPPRMSNGHIIKQDLDPILREWLILKTGRISY